MPIPFKFYRPNVRRLNTPDYAGVEWEYEGKTLLCRWTFQRDKDGEILRGEQQRCQAARDTFAVELERPTWTIGVGQVIQQYTEDEMAERGRAAELRRELFAAYASAIIDHEDAGFYASQLGISPAKIDADNRLIQRYLRCRELFDGRDAALQKVREFHDAHPEWDDAMAIPSKKREYAGLKLAADNALMGRRGMLDCQRERPDLFVTVGHDVRLVCEPVAA